MRQHIIPTLVICVLTLASCSRKPTVWLTEKTYLILPSEVKTANRIHGTVRSKSELEAVLRKFPTVQMPDFLSAVDFSRDVVILSNQSDITRVRIVHGGLGLIYVKPNRRPGLGIAVATGEDVGKLGKFIEDTE